MIGQPHADEHPQEGERENVVQSEQAEADVVAPGRRERGNIHTGEAVEIIGIKDKPAE